MKSKTSAALFAFFLGGFGAHQFYLGNTKRGLLYLFFFWTLIPAFVAIIDFIMLLTKSQQDFDLKYNALAMALAKPQQVIVNVNYAPGQPVQTPMVLPVN